MFEPHIRMKCGHDATLSTSRFSSVTGMGPRKRKTSLQILASQASQAAIVGWQESAKALLADNTARKPYADPTHLQTGRPSRCNLR